MLNLTQTLDAVRRRWLLLRALRVSAHALVGTALVAAAAALAERWFQPSDGAALALAAVTVLLVIAAAAIVLWPLRRRPDDRQIARFVEERCPDLDDAVVTAVDIQQRGHEHSAFAPLVIQSAAARLAAVDLSQCVDPREIRAAAWWTTGAAFALVLAFVLAGPLFERASQIAYLRLFPSSISIQVRSGDMRVAAGRPVTISASVDGRRGTLTRIVPSVTLDAAAGQVTTVPMVRAGDGYQLRIGALDGSFKYTVAAGPAVSRAYSVTALHPSRVQRIEVHYDYPSFTGLKPRIEADGGDVYAPAGTRVRLIVHTDKPVSTGRLAFSQGQPAVPLTRVSDRRLESVLMVNDESAYRVGLVDPDGLSSEGIEYFVRVMDDRPPDVHILRPAGDTQITPLEEVPIEARADDDFGIASLDMVYSVSGGAEKIVPFTSLGGTRLARIGSRVLAAEDLRVRPGDVIAYYARARDVPRAKQSTLTRSEIFFLEVRPFNEEYTLAQSQAGMSASSAQQVEGLISSQKEIISATWNLERRSTAGRSRTDIKNVADAQAELKGRAEQAAGTSRQRRRIGQEPPLQIVTGPPRAHPPAGDPVRDAVDAMGRALQQLQTQKTADAIPHEMAALNALLQAQADVRNRQVQQQQQGSIGGNGNRQGQDLSNLFDRELKRQSQNSYETKAQVEAQPEGPKADSALDKIKDLARRQEELSRRQRDLAKGGLSAEEMKRQLEKLTREEEELRRQVEEAAKQLGDRAKAADGARGANSAGANGAEGAKGAQQDLNRAVEQMRDAASQGKQDDAAGAAAKGEEAARQLRNAESRMQQGSPGAKRRALGDLQLESQQIAEAQRRVASEAERLDREGGGAADARRRLAGEKEQLADRVDALQEAAGRLGNDQENAGQAARDLAAQRLGQRMRNGAQALRDAKAGKTAPAEQQIADALDKVARKMNGADAGGAKGNTATLGDQLDELRDARDRLARLEKQIADAKQAAEGPRGRNNAQQPGRAGQDGPEGRQGQRGSQGDGQGGGDLSRLQQAYNKELQRTRELMDRVQRGTPESAGRMTTPEEHEWSRSAPGTEAFKQDYAAWQSLASDVAKALERTETAVAGRLSKALAKDRLHAGGSERVPDAYRTRVSKYFESIATIKK
ncbi:MAG TPA: hypothetical protein VF921_03385 [Vicinamibacterales bacterium]